MNLSFLFLPLLPATSLAFRVWNHSPKNISYLAQGDDITLSCSSDNWWKWCTFKHAESGKVCDFQWKFEPYNVTVLDCDDFAGRFEFVGDYNNYNCAVKLTGMTGQEAGKWRCEMEEFWKGLQRGAGDIDTVEFEIEVEVPNETEKSD